MRKKGYNDVDQSNLIIRIKEDLFEIIPIQQKKTITVTWKLYQKIYSLSQQS